MVDGAKKSLEWLLNRKQVPLVRNALEGVRAAIAKLKPRPCDQVLDRARDQYLVRTGYASDPRTDVHRDADHAVTCEFTLAGVQSSAHLKS